MSKSWNSVLSVLILLGARSAARADAPLCPKGEITLGPGVFRALRRSDPGKVVSRGGTFVVPSGVTIDPANEPVVFAIEGDRQPIAQMALPAGALASRSRGRRFAFRHGTSKVILLQVNGAYRLSVGLDSMDLSALDPANPPHFMKQILKIGDDCFASVLACSGRGSTVSCQTDRTVLLTGRARSGKTALAGALLTLFDDARLETVSVFAQEDGHFAFPRLRPGSYRLRARLIGYEDMLQSNVILSKGHKRVDFAMSPTSDTNVA